MPSRAAPTPSPEERLENRPENWKQSVPRPGATGADKSKGDVTCHHWKQDLERPTRPLARHRRGITRQGAALKLLFGCGLLRRDRCDVRVATGRSKDVLPVSQFLLSL